MKFKVATFEEFAYSCPCFTTEPWVNNGYGCKHPEQEEMSEDNNGNKFGACFCWSCPLGVEADSEDLDNPDIDWDGLCEEREVTESEYLIVTTGPDATTEEKEAFLCYERHINRYNPGWKEGAQS